MIVQLKQTSTIHLTVVICCSIVCGPLQLCQTQDVTTQASQTIAVTSETSNLPPFDATDEPSRVETSTLANVSTATSLFEAPQQTTTEEPNSAPSNPKQPIPCADDNYCLNGGTCVISDSGQKLCICPESYYGSRCHLKNICKTIIVDSLNGDQICAKIQRPCFKNDKFFRCSCLDDEYFIFKTKQKDNLQAEAITSARIAEPAQRAESYLPQPALFTYEGSDDDQESGGQQSSEVASYIAKCKKIDECLGVRCRQKSEVCLKGECVCNQQASYIRDPTDNLCKLINPCLMPTPDGKPICGQAQCVATYDQDLFRCICPIGYRTLKREASRSSTRCVLTSDFICKVPLLNNCQHICEIDQLTNSYKCSCLPGYIQGSRPGLDDHLCFFDEHPEGPNIEGYGDELQSGSIKDGNSNVDGRLRVEFKMYTIPKLPSDSDDYHLPDEKGRASIHEPARAENGTFVYDPITPVPSVPVEELDEDHLSKSLSEELAKRAAKNSEVRYIKREVRSIPQTSQKTTAGRADSSGRSDSAADLAGNYDLQHPNGNLRYKLTAQERCNMFCEENKICVLENGSTDSYRCVCDRQGYVSIGDRCLDWCSAAEFSYRVQFWLDNSCYSGVCETYGDRPSRDKLPASASELERLVSESSWRPSFQCDCTHSPLLIQDPQSKLCKLDFQAILNPCLPGNEGYLDCVENKNAYCAVLHKVPWQFFRDLRKERPAKNDSPSSGSSRAGRAQIQPGVSNSDNVGSNQSCKSPRKPSEKLYTCVCSPDKKFLVDKPRNKARCVDECDLLNTECGRFNRMCRSATMAPDDYGREPLIRMDTAGQRMNVKRTGCECLPGFNVGPSELLDFTLDDNVDSNSRLPSLPGGFGGGGGGGGSSLHEPDEPSLPVNILGPGDDTEHLRAKYMNINSRCLLDYDVIEFHASFKAPADFDPSWVTIRNAESISQSKALKIMQSRMQGRQKNRLSRDKTTTSSSFASEKQADNIESMNNNGTSSVDRPSQATKSTTARPKQLNACQGLDGCILEPPDYMHYDIAELHKSVVLVSECDYKMASLSLEAYQECTKYRYWLVQKLRENLVDWRKVVNTYLYQTFDLMEGNIRVRVNKCEASIRNVLSGEGARLTNGSSSVFEGKQHNWLYISEYQPAIPKKVSSNQENERRTGGGQLLDPMDQHALIDADIHCELTLHSASDRNSSIYSRKVFLERQLPKFIFVKPKQQFGDDYYLMAPNMLIRRESFDQLAEHRKIFDPCHSSYEYCDKQTKCEMVDAVNFTCTCDFGYTPIGARDIYHADSRKEVCEDINECLFDVCKELENVSTCINEIGDYRCQCNRHYTGDNKRYCTHVCNTIPCKHGKCRLMDDHHAFCECEDGYKEADCSVQDPNVALRKANMIICGSIFTSVLLLAITFAISLNSQLKKTKKKLKRFEAASEAARMFEFTPQQTPFRSRMSKVSSCS